VKRFLVVVVFWLGAVSQSYGASMVCTSAYCVPSPSIVCADVLASFVRVYEAAGVTSGYKYVPVQCWHSGLYRAFGDVEVGDTIHFNRFNSGGFVDYWGVALTEIWEAAPDLSVRVSTYPVGEVVVYCAALLLFALGIKIGS